MAASEAMGLKHKRKLPFLIRPVADGELLMTSSLPQDRMRFEQVGHAPVLNEQIGGLVKSTTAHRIGVRFELLTTGAQREYWSESFENHSNRPTDAKSYS